MDALLQDLRYGARLVRSAPAFTAVVVLTVALGIAANTAVFAVVHAALLRSLPYPDADRLVVAGSALAPGIFLEWREQATSFSALAGVTTQTFDVTGFDRPERIDGAIVNASFFDVMGVPPSLGRPFVAADEQRSEKVVIIGDAYWRGRFGGDPRAIGSSIVINGEPFAIVGVMPPGFEAPSAIQAWVPPRHLVPEYPLLPTADATQMRSSHYLGAYGRLKPLVSRQAAQTEQRVIFERLLKRYPDDMLRDDLDLPLITWREWLVGDIAPALVVLFAVVGLVLLIGCANIANLMLARSTSRAQEISVRAALGAGWGRIVRQLITESVLLALLGGTVGVLAAAWVLPVLTSLSPRDVRDVRATLSVPVVCFGFAVSLLTGILFGCAPALGAARGAVAESLKSHGRTASSRQGRLVRQSLIVAECAVCVALLVAAGLLIRSFVSLRQVNPGFAPVGLQTARIDLPAARYGTPAMQARFFDALLERLRAGGGTRAVAAAARLPFVAGNSIRGVELDRPIPGLDADAGIRIVSPGYFDVMQQPLRAGRAFTDRDRPDAPMVAVVNETMARRYWPGENAVGHRFRVTNGKAWLEIVGIVADVKHGSLRESVTPEFYQSYAQAPWIFMTLVIRTPMPPASMSAALEHELAAVDPAMPVPAVRSMSELIGTSFALDRFEMVGLGVFAAVALALAMIGLYGVMSYVVSRRTREIGVRMALGATPASILRLVIGEGLGLTVIGLEIGLIAAVSAARALRAWLFGVRPSDPATLIGVTLLLTAVALLASYLPARRATAVDPMKALRGE